MPDNVAALLVIRHVTDLPIWGLFPPIVPSAMNAIAKQADLAIAQHHEDTRWRFDPYQRSVN